MFEGLVFGFLQGVTEWLPISSEGLIVLFKTNFFQQVSLDELLKLALFLHLGTTLSAVVYFRRDIVQLFKTLFHYKRASEGDRKLFNFLFIVTLVSGGLGLVMLRLVTEVSQSFEPTSRALTLIIGVLLLITAAILHYRSRASGETNELRHTPSGTDSLIVGLAQGLAVLPGLSRSGLTTSGLLLRRFKDHEALRLSFLASIPVVLAGNVVLNFKPGVVSLVMIVGLIASFIFGLASIHLLIKLAEKISLDKFVFIFGLLMILAVLV